MTQAPPFSLSKLVEMVGNHLWQSTVFLGAAGLLTLALRNNRAQVRYGVWLAASVKFLIPFAALVAIGSEFGWRSSLSIAPPDMTLVVDAVSQPFSRPELRTAAAAPVTSSLITTALLAILGPVWFCGCAAILLRWWVADHASRRYAARGWRCLHFERRAKLSATIGSQDRRGPAQLADAGCEGGTYGDSAQERRRVDRRRSRRSRANRELGNLRSTTVA